VHFEAGSTESVSSKVVIISSSVATIASLTTARSEGNEQPTGVPAATGIPLVGAKCILKHFARP